MLCVRESHRDLLVSAFMHAHRHWESALSADLPIAGPSKDVATASTRVLVGIMQTALSIGTPARGCVWIPCYGDVVEALHAVARACESADDATVAATGPLVRRYADLAARGGSGCLPE